MAVALLASFSIGLGTLAAQLFQGGGGSEPSYSAGKAGDVRSHSVDPIALREPADAMEGPVAFQGERSAQNTPDKPISQEFPNASTNSLNVLVLGVDRRPGDAEGTSSHSDTMMLVRLTPQTGMVKLLSVPR